jgi:AraC-like DNA-binding protein
MSYIARRASERLRGIVERVWHVERDAAAIVPETICPDGRSEIVLHLGDPMLEQIGAALRSQPRHLLVGQMTAPATVIPSGRIAMVGARLAPSALHRLLGIPQHQVAGRVIDLEDVWPAWVPRTADQIAAEVEPAARLAALERALEALIPSEMPDDAFQRLDAAVAQLQASGGQARIDLIARQLGTSRRQFERRFRAHVGLSPRLFGRIIRFQRAFRAIDVESGAAIAARCGFADQAHLVHEIRRFAGQTPTLLAEAGGLTRFFRQ